MKVYLFLIFLFYFAIHTNGQKGADTLTLGMNGNWNLLESKNLVTGEITDTSKFQNRWETFYKHVKLIFQYYDTSGKIHGQSFYNDVGGYYKICDKNKISATSLGGTEVYCLFESKLWDAFRDASSYRKVNDTLFILYNNDSDEMVFIPCNCHIGYKERW